MASQSAKEKAKRLGENFLSKLVDSFHSPEKDDQPHKPPFKPSQSSSSSSKLSSSHHMSDQDVFPTFGNLSIHDHATPAAPSAPASTSPSFVGGFHPSMPKVYAPSSSSSNNHAISESNLTRPMMAMPTPFDHQSQSLTMQMALRPPDAPLRVHSNPLPSGASNPDSAATPTKLQRPSIGESSSAPVTPKKPRRSNSGTPTSTPSQKAGQQCSGVTKANKRCTRMVKFGPAFASFESDDSDPIERFCHQHEKEVMEPTGYYAGTDIWVAFEDWIPHYLQQETQALLRAEMHKPRSPADVPGYIYTFEIREPGKTDTIKLKVGRTVNLVKRIDQWGKQCGSKEQVLRGFYPGTVDSEEDGGGGGGRGLMKGRVIAGDKGPWCHRLERLIHIELADIASLRPYLDPVWPIVDATEDKSKISSPIVQKTCPDCGSLHKEIFEFQRWTRGPHKGKEWEDLVKPVVDRWGKFVELYV